MIDMHGFIIFSYLVVSEKIVIYIYVCVCVCTYRVLVFFS